MSSRFRKSVSVMPGVKVNIGKKSVGVSVGGKFGGVSVNSKSGMSARVSAPGTGISYRTKLGSSSSKTNNADIQYSDNPFTPSDAENKSEKSNSAKVMFGRICLGIAVACSSIAVILAFFFLK